MMLICHHIQRREEGYSQADLQLHWSFISNSDFCVSFLVVFFFNLDVAINQFSAKVDDDHYLISVDITDAYVKEDYWNER